MRNKFKLLRTIAVVILVAEMLSGCASVFTGTRQEVTINSVPSGARVYIDGSSRGRTPVIVNLKRRKRHTVNIELEGYLSQNTAMTRGHNGWTFGNMFFLFGFLIDVATGAMYSVKPHELDVDLIRANPSGGSAPVVYSWELPVEE